MIPTAIVENFRERIGRQVEITPEGNNRYRVITPFRFDDGDHFGIVLKHLGDRWILTDEASTLMHLSYWLDDEDLESGHRQELIQGSLSVFGLENRDGEFIMPVTDEQFGDALFSFIQALSKVSDVSFLSRERVRSTFMEDFRTFFRLRVPEERLKFSWTEPNHDPKRLFHVDCRINGMNRPLLVFALNSDNRVKDATITLLKFETWGLGYRSLGIFEEQQEVNRNDLAKFTDICDKTYSSLSENSARIEQRLMKLLEEGH